MEKTKKYNLKGIVQGVGFRYYIYKKANELNIKGYAKNLLEGGVEIIAEGDEGDLKQFETYLQKGPTLARVDNIKSKEIDPVGYNNFQIKY